MKSNLFKGVVLVIVFVGVIAAILFLNRDDKQQKVYAEWREASLPVVYMNFEGEKVNRLFGYTVEMDKTYMRDTITPVSSDRDITVSVDTYESSIEGISYEIWSLDGEKLYINKKIKDYDGLASSFDIKFNLEDIFSKSTEYQLIITLSTKEYKEINYYTRIRYYDDTVIDGILDYVKNFSTQVLTGNMSNELIYQLESDSSTDNTSFGYTNIKSTYSHVSWGDLNPQLTGDISVAIKEFNEMTGSIMLEYTVSALDESGKTAVLDVDEFFCIKYVNSTYYLIAYERQVNERFELTKDCISANHVELGIVPDKALPLEVTSNGIFNVFAADGDLWCFNSAQNSAVRVFSFKEAENDVRTLLDNHEFQVVSVDKDGNIQFTVAGYMNGGMHEGKCGVGFYEYTAEDNMLNEIFFMQSVRPYDVIAEELGKLSFMGNNDMYYLVYGDSLFSVDFSGMEYVEIADTLTDNIYAVDAVNGIAAWQEQDDWSKCTSIRQMFFTDGTDYTINAEEGEYIRVLGFLDGDLIIGRAYAKDIVMEGSSVVDYPMYKLEIINSAHETESEYFIEGYYISGITVDNERIIIERQTRSVDGSFAAASEDVLIRNWESEKASAKVTSEIMTLRKRVYSLEISDIAFSKALSVKYPEIPGSTTENLSMAASEEGEQDNRFYAYSCGSLAGVTESVRDAINLVYNDMGIVVDSKQNYIWTRANRSTTRSIQVPAEYAAADEASTLAACVNTILSLEGKKTDADKALEKGRSAYDILNNSLDNGALNLQGCILNQVLYYVNNGSPVMVYTAQDKVELITGFYGTNTIIMYDAMLQNTYTISWEEAENLFSANGNVFLSYVK